ncbi:hypothetical protein AnigIFM59636_001530 [Aspergillus niger]|uniref:Contig An12c0330, genomic contig n=2 Tax=Aspergillus niger TaxID=5061 RepID=A2R0P1_ASPNC|nr:uncharacterized protein An12g09280 [Aspergillus niger]GKZ90035.1 hypothetical protein AnigIFM59636_001530 [Aspergillus niger]CAK41358.1 unnamed protein product [Aspergillus niger]
MTTRPLSPPTSPRKRTKAMHLPSSQRICHDWMVVQGNVHYARDRAHFTTYRPVTAHLKNNIFNPMDELEVAGIGTVEIPVVRSLDNPFDTHTIVLENVLHIPEAVCNGFNPLLFGSSMSCTETAWMGADREDKKDKKDKETDSTKQLIVNCNYTWKSSSDPASKKGLGLLLTG